jgi:hypothetical protein
MEARDVALGLVRMGPLPGAPARPHLWTRIVSGLFECLAMALFVALSAGLTWLFGA